MSDGFDVHADGSDYTYGERLAHYQEQYGMHDLPMDRRPAIHALAHELATEEMLTEIHAMLRLVIKSMEGSDAKS